MNEMIQSLISSESTRINNQREEQVINQLEKFGYKFESRFHFIEFLKTRCRLEIAGKLNSLYADDKLVAEWWDTIETKMEVKDGSVTITSIIGNPPASNY
jgi:hypothetical protein